ncbi:MAG: GntR family transcriptional regulator [Paracoccaceae bacterium]
MTDPRTAKAALTAHLQDQILTTALPPGADLDEAQLSRDFALSRTPLREVLRALAGAGYVELRANRGARVSQMSFGQLRSFFQAAPMIYGAVLQLAAGAATSEQLDRLRAAQDVFDAALQSGDARDRTLANHRFHDITGDMAHNPYLLPSFRRLLIDHARIGMTFYRAGSSTRSPTGSAQVVSQTEAQRAASQHHHAIIAAIARRDAAAAMALAHDHWQLSRDQIETFVMPAALDLPLGAPKPQIPA